MAKLSNKQLNNLLRSAFADTAPDNAEDIIRKARGRNTAMTVSVTQEDYKKEYLKRGALIAAGLVFLFGIVLTLILVRTNTPYATICIENDECVEIVLNRDDRPLSVSGKNNAAIRLARKIDVGGAVEEAVDSALDAMLENGNLGENSNTVLITVDAPESEKELLKASFNAARKSFADSDFSGAILTAVASDDKTVARIARHNRVSVGKAEMVSDIIRRNRSFNIENLCRLSVNDLNLLSTSRSVVYTNIGVFGESRGCITPQDALHHTALDLGYSDSDATATLEADLYGLVYSVTVHAKDGIYRYRLNAVSGEIIGVAKDEMTQTTRISEHSEPTVSPTEKKEAKKKTNATEAPTERNGLLPDLMHLLSPENRGSRTADDITPTETASPSDDAPAQTEPPVSDPAKTKPTAKPPQQENETSAPQRQTATQKPAETTHQQTAVQQPTQPKATTPAPVKPKPTQAAATQKATEAQKPKPTTAPKPKPTEPPKRDPAIFTAGTYLNYTGGTQNGTPSSSAKQIGISRVVNGYNVYYDNKTFPYTPAGKQGGVTALVCNAAQFKKLTGTSDSRFDDTYFKVHALYVYMNRDANYHWVKSIAAAYMDKGTLCLKNSEPVGYYIAPESDKADRIYTVVYELNKSDLKDFENMIEYTD